MLPLSAIPPAMPAQNLAPSADVGAPAPPVQPEGPGAAQPASGGSFGNLLGRMVQDVNARQNVANEAMQSVQAGGNVSLHQAVIAMEEANVSFQLMVEVRNKLLDAYQEIMRMQV